MPRSPRRAGHAADHRIGPGGGRRLMPRLPVLSGREVVKTFESLGWSVVRQSGSHIIMVMEGRNVTLSVPDHDEVAKGTLRSLIRSADLTVAEFVSSIP